MPVDESKYLEALDNLRSQIRFFDKIINDPFKAPEQIFELFPSLMTALWNAQVEHVALLRLDQRGKAE